MAIGNRISPAWAVEKAGGRAGSEPKMSGGKGSSRNESLTSEGGTRGLPCLGHDAGQLEPGGLVKGRDPERRRLGGLRAGIGADHDIIGFGRNRAGDVGSKRFGTGFGLGAA